MPRRIKERMIDSPLINDINSDYRPGMPELHIIPEREKAEQLGIPMQRLGFAINAAIGAACASADLPMVTIATMCGCDSSKPNGPAPISWAASR